MNTDYDNIIIGAGIYGLYAAIKLTEKNKRVLVLEIEDEAFKRGSYVNQARLHNGYHYPRSYSTASKSAKYFSRFYNDFESCVNAEFDKIYAVAKNFSWANGNQFKKFSDRLNVRCDEISVSQFFTENEVDKCFLTTEYAFDAKLIRNKMLKDLEDTSCQIKYSSLIESIHKEDNVFKIKLASQESFTTAFILNATYASTNQIHELMGYDKLNIKYELCEVILCDVSSEIENVGLTVMDGPFFSVMPFGKAGYHSLTSVSRTPHMTSYDFLPTFECQKDPDYCSPQRLGNCNECPDKPKSAFVEMNQIAKKYLKDSIRIDYIDSIYTIKPIMKTSEIDDSRPTIIKKLSSKPDFYTVFSGKINTIYDLDLIL